jgi:hypothetical protein
MRERKIGRRLLAAIDEPRAGRDAGRRLGRRLLAAPPVGPVVGGGAGRKKKGRCLRSGPEFRLAGFGLRTCSWR